MSLPGHGIEDVRDVGGMDLVVFRMMYVGGRGASGMEQGVHVLKRGATTEGMTHDADRTIDGPYQPQLLDGMDHIVGAGLQRVDRAMVVIAQCAWPQGILCRGAAVAAKIEHEGGQMRMGLGQALGGHPQVLAGTQQTMEEEDGPRAIIAGRRSVFGDLPADDPLMVEDAGR